MTRDLMTGALWACLRLMDRAAPHPNDVEIWHTTKVRASMILAKNDNDDSDMLMLTAITALLTTFVVGVAVGVMVGWMLV